MFFLHNASAPVGKIIMKKSIDNLENLQGEVMKEEAVFMMGGWKFTQTRYEEILIDIYNGPRVNCKILP